MQQVTREKNSIDILRKEYNKIDNFGIEEYIILAKKAIDLGYKYPKERLDIIDYIGKFFNRTIRENQHTNNLVTEFASFDYFNEILDGDWDYLRDFTLKMESNIKKEMAN